MATSIRFPCISNIFCHNHLLQNREISSIYKLISQLKHIRQFAKMASSNTNETVESHRQGSEKLVNHFAKARANRPARKYQE